MKSAHQPLANDALYRRIDEMSMSAADRERAKANLRSAERFADGIYYVLTAIRSCTAFIARHVRSALASPQH